MEKSARLSPPVLESVSGLVAGGTTALLLSPLDLLRTRMQLQMLHDLPAHLKVGSATFPALHTIWKTQGWRGFFQGFGATALALPTFWACYFTIYSASKEKFTAVAERRNGAGAGALGSGTTALVNAAAATTAALACDVITSPLWVARTRLQSQWLHQQSSKAVDVVYRGPLHALRVMLQREGIRSWYKGLIPSFLGASQVALQLPLYEWLKTAVAASELRLLTQSDARELAGRQRRRFRAAELDSDPELAAVVAISTAEAIDPASLLLPVGAFDVDGHHHDGHHDDAHHLDARDVAAVQDAPGAPAGANGATSAAGDGSSASAAQAGAAHHPTSLSPASGPSALGLLFASVASKMAASLLTYPHETIRARLQDDRGSPGSGGAGPRFKGVIDCTLQTWRGEGIRGLYAGFSVSLVRALPAVACTFYVYETTHAWLARWGAEHERERDIQHEGVGTTGTRDADAAVAGRTERLQ